MAWRPVMTVVTTMRTAARRLLVCDDGQDLVEYALLTAFIGFAGASVVAVILQGLRLGYLSWDSTSQGLWVPADPAGS